MSTETTKLSAVAGIPAPPAKKYRAPLRERSPVLAHLRSVMLAGLLTAIPLFITIYLLSFLFGLVTKYTQPTADSISDHFFGNVATGWVGVMHTTTSAAVAVLISLAIVYVLGLLGSFFIGRQILAQVEHVIENLPLIKGIYGTTKQVIAVFRKDGGGTGFQRVVLVEFPRKGTWTVAFVTNTVSDGSNAKLVCCFIPMTPNPTSGFFQMFPEDDVRATDWTVDLGIKIVLSGGLLAPKELGVPGANATTMGVQPAISAQRPQDQPPV